MIELEMLRNVGILGQGGVGKTSVGEAMLLAAGVTQRLGKIEEGTTLFDFEAEEIKRRISLSTAFHSLPWKKFRLYLIDTPGHTPFLPEAIHSMRAFKGALFFFSPSTGLKVEAEKLWNAASQQQISRLIFVSKMEREKSNPEEAIDAILKGLGVEGVYLQLPIGAEESFRGIVDLTLMKALVFEGGTGKFIQTEIPDELKNTAGEKRVQLMERVAEMDDALLEKYLSGQELSLEELKKGIRAGVLQNKIFPILYGSALRQIGIPQLLDAMVDYLPSPLDEGEAEGKNPVTKETEKRRPDPNGPLSAYVFKTMIDPFAGKLSILRVYSGKIATDMAPYNPNKNEKEKIGQLFRLEGKKQELVHEAFAGEIVAAAKLKGVSTGDTLCEERAPIQFEGLAHFASLISFALEPKTKADEDKVPHGLQRLMEEDPTIAMHRDPQTREFILSGMGQLHIEVAIEKLKRKYGAEVELKSPKVPYKEAIKAAASAQGKYKKQSGGRGQYGDTWLKIEPLPRGKGFEFVDEIVGGAIPRNYIAAVEKGIRETMTGGVIAGFPMVDVRVTLYDGSYHDVDSSDMAFKIAGSMGFKNAVEKARPIILEPIMLMQISVPDDSMGDVIGDVNSRRGKILGMETKSHGEMVKALVPMSEALKYAQDLNSMTRGRGDFTMEFHHYEELPPHLTEKVVKEAKAAAEAEHHKA